MINKDFSRGGNSDVNRALIDNKSTKAILLDHTHNKRDSLYERDSGLNQVLCQLAKDKGVSFIIDLNELLVDDPKIRAQVISRIIQNVMLINKFGNKLRVIFPSNWDSRDVSSFLLTIGSSTALVKNSLG